MGPIGCPETSAKIYHYSLRNDQKSAVLGMNNRFLFLMIFYAVFQTRKYLTESNWSIIRKLEKQRP